jgi:hypothetical protein
MEPRNIVVGADAVAVAEGNTNVLERKRAQGPGTEVHRGRRAGHVHKGSPGTWEALLLPAAGRVPPNEETK